MDQAAIEALPTHQIHDEMNARRARIKELQAERLELHTVLTAREHAEAAAKMNPDASLDQHVRQK